MGKILNPAKSDSDRIQKRLDALDARLARPTQAITAALLKGEEPDAGDVETFEALTAQKDALRALL
jgi:hypothetical protein